MSKAKKKKDIIDDQLEQKFVGGRSEVFTRINSKESEIKKRLNEERRKDDRLIEDSRGKAGEIKRKAILEDIGNDLYEKEIEKARMEAGKIEQSSTAEIERIKKAAEKNMTKAKDMIINAVIKPFCEQ